MNTSPQWQFVGNVPANYERHLVPSIFAPWAHDLIEAAVLQPGERVLDIACGTGIVARTAARTLGAAGVVGLDLSAPMLAAARSAAEAEGVSAEWREGSAAELPMADATFDVAFCQQGLQFFPDRPAALREMYRILVPSGRVVLSVWRGIERSPGFAVLADALTRHISPEAGTLMTSGPFGLGDPEALRTVIAGARFGNITIRLAQKTLRFPSPEEFAIRYVAGSALASLVAGADDDARTALLAEVNARLQSYVDDQGLAFPIESNVAVALNKAGSVGGMVCAPERQSLVLRINQELCNTIRPRKRLSFLFQKLRAKCVGRASARRSQARPSRQSGQLNPPGRPRSKGNPHMRFRSQSDPGTRLSSALISLSG